MTQNKEISFEKGVQRLEHILEKMNTATISLEESMLLFEEADGLINYCGKQLAVAEKKIEVLIKKRSGELELKKDQTPATKDFTLDE